MELVVCAIVGLVLGFGVPIVTGYFLRPPPVPSLDANSQAYLLLLEGVKEGRYEAAKQMFDQAYSMSNDSEIQYLADYFSQYCQLALNSGIATHAEGDSTEGGVKAMVQGFISPLDGLSAWSLMFKQWFGDFDKNCDIVDARYQPLIRAYFAAQQQAEDAKKNSSHFSWGAFVMTLLVFFAYAVDSTKRAS